MDNEDSDQTVCFHTLWLILDCLCIWTLGYKIFFMLNSAEHENNELIHTPSATELVRPMLQPSHNHCNFIHEKKAISTAIFGLITSHQAF